jgi:eukaryotic-like serine/threonine-protein kinase
MSDQPAFTPDESRRFAETCRRFEDALRKGLQPSIDVEAAAWSGPQRTHVQKELVALTRRHRSGSGAARSAIASRVKSQADEFGTFDPNAAPREAGPADAPDRIGRYRIKQVLGEGSFGRVYLGHDDDLDRAVAIKVPLSRRVARAEDVEAFLTEARTVAALSHPHIVAVYDVGRTENGLCFVVSKFIEGTDLVRLLKKAWPSFAESAKLVATVAEALHYAHRHGLVHRDVKPANILIDATGEPILADFGLALKDADVGKGNGFAGTPAYMSPEQANGEGHRVDGRSDIFSLGVVFYELLTRRRPFKGDAQQIIAADAKPPRQFDDAIPKELERICLKALAKRASDRYTAAKDMADDLTHYLAELGAGQLPTTGPRSTTNPQVAAAGDSGVSMPAPAASLASTPGSGSSVGSGRGLKIVPKGLRSFDVHDASFFLELLPGPRDRDGLPDSVRFWKTRIEDADETFAIGLVYGPSGCGKSSLVKAGLLPRLASSVETVYIEATAAETEARLLAGIRKRCPALADDLSLKATLEAIRRGHGLPTENKLLLVIDQLEQWLHAKKETESSELVQALRQCDGQRLQAIVLVRDDFWMAATRFLRELEVRLVDGDNAAAVDLFPIRHAEKVLASFGRAFGCLPEKLRDASRDHQKFLEQAVAGLVEEGKVIPVRLALFAEMMKGKTWTPAELKAVGGAEGVGVAFLEETFSAKSAPPEHRHHQKAARAVLKALLPESGTDIKGHMRSRAQLLQASGYASRPEEFDDLIRILDGKIRLLTPTDPAGAEAADKPKKKSAGRCYQLTHDYLVPSIRDWLARKQKETPRGRAELLLADRATVWNARPESRQLPSLGQWCGIRSRTSTSDWSSPERKMMAAATRHHAIRGAALTVCLAVVAAIGLVFVSQAAEQRNAIHAAGLVQQLDTADIAHVPTIVAELAGYRRWADPLLKQSFDKAEPQSRAKLHACLALLPVDPAHANHVYDRLLDAEPNEVAVLIAALAPHKADFTEKLWHSAETPERGKESRRLRAASALATFDPHGDKWATIKKAVVDDLVSVPIVHLGLWTKPLREVRKTLLVPLTIVYGDPGRREIERSLATDILADYAADEPRTLADLLMTADSRQFASLFPIFKKQPGRACRS